MRSSVQPTVEPQGNPSAPGHPQLLRQELASRGIGFPRVAGETHAIPGHDEAVQRADLEAVLDAPRPEGGRT